MFDANVRRSEDLLLLLIPSNLPPPEALALAAVKLTGASTLPQSPKQSPKGTPLALPSCDIPLQLSQARQETKKYPTGILLLSMP